MKMIDDNNKTARMLTPKERERCLKIMRLSEELESEGFVEKDLTVSIVRANIMAFVIGIPLCAPFAAAFFFLHSGVTLFTAAGLMIMLAVFAVCVVVHELIHGFFWGLFAKGHFKSIEFGFIKEYATPYCTCLEPLNKLQYVIGGIMPGIILGIVPMAVSLFNASFLWLMFGMLMTLAARGDFKIVLKLLCHRKSGTEAVYLDHPTECGLIVFER